MDKLKIGIVIADDTEYIPVREYILQKGGQVCPMYNREGHTYTFTANGKQVEVCAVFCGIGMVNAAVAAMHFVAGGADILVNAGLSGGMQRVRRGELALGTGFVEHDFDLTPLGYKPGEKPLQNNFYTADAALCNSFKTMYPGTKSGTMVSGDCFISDDQKRDYLIGTFDAIACDMESAAIAYVAELADKRYISIRKISDDAGNDANELYTEVNTAEDMQWMHKIFKWIETLPSLQEIWK